MSFIVNPTYRQNSMINYLSNDGRIAVGKIIAIRAYQSCNYRKDACTIYYDIEPEEFIGTEHDSEIVISEVVLNVYNRGEK